jgi:hypothetical protein
MVLKNDFEAGQAHLGVIPGKHRFEPKWPDEPNYLDGLYYPDDMEDRTPHPKAVPEEVTDIIASTYTSNIVIENNDMKFTLLPKLPIE